MRRYTPQLKSVAKSDETLIDARCLKTTEKVSFNIASEAGYAYILNEQKKIKIAKNCPFWRFFENLKLAVKQCYQTGQIWLKMLKIKIQMRHFE